MAEYSLLVCTVGETCEPIVVSIVNEKPARVVFICSEQSRNTVDLVREQAKQDGHPVTEGMFDIVVVRNPWDLESCIVDMERLDLIVRDWLKRGEDFSVVVDITGGTKCMTVALGLTARPWPCQFNYVGGIRREEDGTGRVVVGSGKPVRRFNPWKTLGREAVAEFVHFFNGGLYEAAAEVLDAHKAFVRPEWREAFKVLKFLATAYATWDRFQHRKASENLRRVRANLLLIVEALPAHNIRSWLPQLLDEHICFLENISKWDPPTPEHLFDLFANARRCAKRNHFDDAVARLYRTIEALAQLRLKQYGFKDTGAIQQTKLPPTLKHEWALLAENETIKVGLARAYQLLAALDDPIAKTFFALDLASDKSPLSIRNKSILAHGFSPVTKSAFDSLLTATQQLLQSAGIESSDVPAFPTL